MARVKKTTENRLQAKTKNQEYLIQALDREISNGDGAFVFAIGSAGTGKTYVSTIHAVEQYLAKRYTTIVIVKPTIGPDENGFLPGTIEEKTGPWLETVTAPIKSILGEERFKREFGKSIIAAPLEFIRGKTFDHAIIIVDEAQNLTIGQMDVTLTRIGEASKMVFCGDTAQIDLNTKKTESGLVAFVNELYVQEVEGIDVIRFTSEDCVRSAACKKALKIIERSYERRNKL